MGSSISKRFARSNRTNSATGNGSPSGNNKVRRILKDDAVKGNYNAYSVAVSECKSEEVEDAKLKDIMRTQLALDSQVFVLNQLLLGVQFFANYDVDIEKSKDRVRTEQNLKSEKIRHCNKSVMMTNELSDAIDKSVVFQMRHGPTKNVKRNLFNHKLYIVHDNVEISNEGTENMTYSSMSYLPSYRLEFDKKYKKHAGFVRLRFCDRVPLRNPDVVEEVMSSDRNDSTETSTSTTSRTMSSLYASEDVLVIKKRGIYNSSQGSTSSEYDYTYMASFNEHRPLMATNGYVGGGGKNGGGFGRITDPNAASILPEECVTEIKRMITVSTVDNASSPSDNLEDKFQYMEQRGQYLNSKMFMNYFKRIFRDQISVNLEIGSEQLMHATWKGASIYCPVLQSQGNILNHYEIIPAIACPWPSEALDWFQRKRVLAAAPNAPSTWMTEEMINRIFDLTCHAIPIGYVSKSAQRSNNMNRSLEWKVIFPDAERYLESRLSDCQLKVYILVKILYKTYIEPLNIPMSSKAAGASVSMPDLTASGHNESMGGGGSGSEDLRSHFNFITDEHLRAHLFTQCELNTIKWNEFNLGGNLMAFLRTFLQRVQTKNLPDFFLPKRNLFENVPENVITRLHENIFRILENPVMFVMRALRNVRFVRKFYPKINMKRLYTILTISEPLALINPALCSDKRENSDEEEEDHEDGEGEKDGEGANYPLSSMAEYHQKAQADPEKRRLTKLLKFEERMKLKRLAATNRKRESIESINNEIIVTDHMHKYRRKATYELFVRQYLQAGQKCLEFENHKFVTIYVRQARRLADLLKEDHFEIDAQELQQRIQELEQLQKHPSVSRSQSNAQASQPPLPLKKIDIWRPPATRGPDSPAANNVVSPMTFSPTTMSPEMGGSRKSILKNGTSSSDGTTTNGHRSSPPPPQQLVSITAEIHQQHRSNHHSQHSMDNQQAISAKTSPIFRHPPQNDAARTLNKTTAIKATDKGGDYKTTTTIELVDKKRGGDIVHQITSQFESQDQHVSIL